MDILRCSLFSALLVGCSFICSAEEQEGVANYAYSVFVGTGRYRIDDRIIYVFRVPLAFQLRPVDADDQRAPGLKLLLPVAFGLTDFGDMEEFPGITVDDLQTISVVPGVELNYMVGDGWVVKPFAQAGFGTDTKSDSESFVWGGGLRASRTLGKDERWRVGGELLRAGNSPAGDERATTFTRLGFGAEYRLPLQQELFGRRMSWHLRAISWYFSDEVDFEPPLKPTRLNSSFEVGVSVGFDRPFNILGYQFRQGGIGFEGSNDYKAITLFTTFPF